MHEYRVEIKRTAHQSVDVVVKAENVMQAQLKAIEMAGDIDFVGATDDYCYTASVIEEIQDPKEVLQELIKCLNDIRDNSDDTEENGVITDVYLGGRINAKVWDKAQKAIKG